MEKLVILWKKIFSSNVRLGTKVRAKFRLTWRVIQKQKKSFKHWRRFPDTTILWITPEDALAQYIKSRGKSKIEKLIARFKNDKLTSQVNKEKRINYKFKEIKIPHIKRRKPPLIPQVLLPEDDDDKKLYQGLFKNKKLSVYFSKPTRARGKIFDFWGENFKWNFKPQTKWWRQRLRVFEYRIAKKSRFTKKLVSFYGPYAEKDYNKALLKEFKRSLKGGDAKNSKYWLSKAKLRADHVLKTLYTKSFFQSWLTYWKLKQRLGSAQFVADLVKLAAKMALVRKTGWASWKFYYSQGLERPRMEKWSRWRKIRFKRMRRPVDHFFDLDRTASVLLLNTKRRINIVRFLTQIFCKQRHFSELGFMGLFMNIAVISNLVTSGRKSYLLIKHGFFTINSRCSKNPYISLRVGDRYGVVFKHLKLYFKFLKWMYTNRKIVFVMPRFITVSYKSLVFCVGRAPLQSEKFLFPFVQRYDSWLVTTKKNYLKNNKNYIY